MSRIEGPGIQGKVIAITGAGSGIGEATALLLAERGAKVVLADLRSESIEKVAARIDELGGEGACCQTDVTRRQDVESPSPGTT